MPSHAPPRRRARPHVSARSRAFARAHTSAIFPSPSSAPVSRSRPSSPACPLSVSKKISLSRALHIRTFPVLFIARRRSRRRGGRHAVRRGTVVVVHRRRARRRVPCGSSKVFFLGVCSGNIGRSDTRGLHVPPVPPSVTHESRPRVPPRGPDSRGGRRPGAGRACACVRACVPITVVVVVVRGGRRRPWSSSVVPWATIPCVCARVSTTGGGRPRDVVDVDASISIDRCVDASIDVDIDRHIAARRRARGCRGFDRESRWRRR